MWMTNNITANFQNHYRITNKFANYKGKINVELFNSELFEQIALITYNDNVVQGNTQQEVITQRFHYIEGEVISQVPYCVVKEAKRVLICGTLNIQIAYFFALNNIEVDMVVGDNEALYTLSGFFPHFKEVIENPKIHIYDNFLSLENPKYDIIIHLGHIKTHEFNALSKMVNKDFAIIMRLSNLYLEPSIALNALSIAKDFGNILMPFIIPSFMCGFYAFLSKTLHPLADLQLQKSDMLENMQFYNSNLHTSMFRLPSVINRMISPYVKN
ncbi:spermidine synthase spee [Helicobacter didelphidarum]|uniref:Spermidine synthase spee n=1 Tax=Helicobacter didelphidarum TaxID=2040648 RepID=A0A3D8IPW3_9HELI|nr:spermidine synthase spee [Helicobacter didelphidarum]RDU67143.1 spermidine synthase spee [Helicobacter didelphidarum]